MKPPLTFSLLCDKNRLFSEKRMPFLYKPTERKIERRKEREISQLVDFLKYFAANVAIILEA